MFLKHYTFGIYNQYFCTLVQYFGTLVSNLGRWLKLQVPRQYSNFGDVIRKTRNKFVNRALKSDLESTVTNGHITELYYISGDCALIPRQSTNCNQKHGGFWPNLRHFDVTVSLFSCRTPLTRYLSGKNLSMSRGQWMAP